MLLLSIVFLIFSCSAQEKNLGTSKSASVSKSMSPGANQREMYISLLRDKKVAVVGNQTSQYFDSKTQKSTHLVDFLLASSIKVVKVFSPEHGFRGGADAGAKVNSSIDPITKLPIVSLYGDNKKPKKDQLNGVDVIVFDLQDVGVRFYTYISTLTYVMEAAAEENIPVIILDRPNPNGMYIDGPVLKKGFESFVGMHSVPVLYGMTIGEYGMMINGEGWLKDNAKCDLTVIKILNYDRNTSYSLPVSPSPNLKSDNAINKYASLCLFEGTTISVGRGTDTPFEVYGHPKFTNTGFSFTPVSKPGATKPLHLDVVCNGYSLKKEARLSRGFDLSYLFEAKKQFGTDLKWINSVRFFNLLAGSDDLYNQLKDGKTKDEIYQSWEADLIVFKAMREKYLIY